MKTARDYWLIAKVFLKVGFWFWLGETLYFLIQYSWHVNAINEAEKMCDKIAGITMFVGFAFAALAAKKIIDELLNND